MVYFLWHSDTNTGITLLYGIAYQAIRTAGTSTLSVGNKFPVTNVTLRVLDMGNVNVSTMYWGEVHKTCECMCTDGCKDIKFAGISTVNTLGLATVP